MLRFFHLAMPVSSKPYLSNYLFLNFLKYAVRGSKSRIHSITHHIDVHDDYGIMLLTAQYDAIGILTVKPI